MAQRPVHERAARDLVEGMVTAILDHEPGDQATVAAQLLPGEEMLCRSAASIIAAVFEGLARQAAKGGDGAPDAATIWRMQLQSRSAAGASARKPSRPYIEERVGRDVRVVTAENEYAGILRKVEGSDLFLYLGSAHDDVRVPLEQVRELWVRG